MMRFVATQMPFSLVLAMLLTAAPGAHAVTSTESVASAFEGNGHNISFDGRLLVVRTSAGWQVRLFRPEAITYGPSGFPDAMGAMWSPSVTLLVGSEALVENAVAICETDAAKAPYTCDEDGQPAAGPFDCYDVWLIDSDAVTPVGEGGFVLRRRRFQVWVASPRTASATIHRFELSSSLEPLQPTLRGIEPTVTADGKLMVWQGHPNNGGDIDNLVYAYNADACALSGWSTPKSISHMAADPNLVGRYRLAERSFRAADGSTFSDGTEVKGAYPWLMPSGDALVFMASNMPCRAEEDPPGCGPRRNSLAVLGYATNWGIAIADGAVNPSTTDTVRLFFSSPGPTAFPQVPVSDGVDVWPFFGSNTQNYVELIFDDGLDGQYAGFWHFNENVDAEGNLDLGRTPDVSGYFNTAVARGGLQVSPVNDGIVGRAMTFDGIDDRLEVAPSIVLNPVNGITIDFWIRPTVDPDCDGANNYRVLLSKGGLGDGAYSVVLEDTRVVHVRFNVGGTQESLVTPPIEVDQWTRVRCEYDGPSGQAGCWLDDQRVATEWFAVGTLMPTDAPLLIGGPGVRASCPDTDGAFAGMLDELSISRYARTLGTPPIAEEPDGGPASAPGDGGPGMVGGDDDAQGCGCRSRSPSSSGLGALMILTSLLWAGRRSARRRGLLK